MYTDRLSEFLTCSRVPGNPESPVESGEFQFHIPAYEMQTTASQP